MPFTLSSQENFCDKCKVQGLFDETKIFPENCVKCQKERYFTKHQNYCEIKCGVVASESSTDETTTPVPEDLGPLGNFFKFLVGATTFQ